MSNDQYSFCQECPYFKEAFQEALKNNNDMGSVVSDMWRFVEVCFETGCKNKSQSEVV